MGWNILNTLDLAAAPEAIAALEEVGALTHLPPEREIVLPRIGEFDAYMASASLRVDEGFLERAGRLKLIGSPSTGSDHIQLDAVRARGIDYFDIAREFDVIDKFSATSEMAFGLLLALVRKIPAALETAKTGNWARERYTGFQLLDKTLGVLGLGRLGRISARIGRGFGMRVIAHDTADVSADGVEMVGFDDLIGRSDVLTIHLHLNDETVGLIGDATFTAIRPSAILLNTSRGRIVDEGALLRALEGKQILGAGLDVIDGEWLSEEDLRRHPLISYARSHDNLLITPHIGGATVESIYGARVFVARKMAEHIRQHAL